MIKRDTKKNCWVGSFIDELSGIYNWSISADAQKVAEFMNDTRKNVNSFEGEYLRNKSSLNKVYSWAEQELEQFDGKSFVGCFNVEKKHDTLVDGIFLFPAYLSFCKRFKIKPVSHRNFIKKTIQACEDLGFKNVTKGRNSTYVFITNIRVKSIVTTFQYKVGGDIDISNTDISRNSSLNNEKTLPPKKTKETERVQLKVLTNTLNPEMVDCYIKNLTKKSNIKRSIDKFSKTIDFTDKAIENMLENFKEGRNLKDPSYSYISNKREHFFNSAKKIKEKGLTIYEYKSLGISPRITPARYKNTINSMNKFFRGFVFKEVGDYIKKEHKMILLDLDLVSCYTMVLLALYTNDLIKVGLAVKSGSIWDALRKEFVNIGKEELYQKPYVKACFYSVIFSGGANAMIESILLHIRNGLGMVESEFKATDFYEDEKYKAGELAAIFNQLPMVQEFRAMSEKIAKVYDGDFFTGPTGHTYPINNTEFRKSFASYLQCFEAALLCESNNEALKKFPEAQLFFHFHDGNVIAVKEEQAVDFLKEIKNQVTITTKKLKLDHIQQIELQASYPQDEELKKV